MNEVCLDVKKDDELIEVIQSFNEVTDRLKSSHEVLVDEVRRLREQLDEKNKELARKERLAALGEMAAGLAHEIRNPLAGIRLYAGLLKQDLEDRPQQLEVVHRLDRGVQALEGIVCDILMFAGNAKPRMRQATGKEVLEEVLSIVCGTGFQPVISTGWKPVPQVPVPQVPVPQVPVPHLYQALNATIEVEPALEYVLLNCDVNQISRALINLTFNALDAAGEGGHVWLRLAPPVANRCHKGLVGIVVEDDGEGIREDIKERLFNPFFTTKQEGTGLGLAIVHRIAQDHGGWVAVENREEGGARFTLAVMKNVEGRIANNE